MTHLTKLAALSIVLLFTITMSAQTQTGNGLAKGVKVQTATTSAIQTGLNWVDENGDGICDNYGTENQGSKQGLGRKGKGQGLNNGTGTRGGFGDGTGVRPQDGTGFGRKGGNATGTGTCDGTGPKGSGSRGNK